MIRYTMDDNGERVTEMNIKKLASYVGVCTTVAIALFGWGYNLSREVTLNTAASIESRAQYTELKDELKSLHIQNQNISKQLTELLHRQDVRINLLEQSLEHLKELNNGR